MRQMDEDNINESLGLKKKSIRSIDSNLDTIELKQVMMASLFLYHDLLRTSASFLIKYLRIHLFLSWGKNNSCFLEEIRSDRQKILNEFKA
jgi:hypothetical protein